MGEKRRFSGREKVALYLAADGQCEMCGADLEPGWHGDHINPYARGGKTDVINGQALCPSCNIEKGSTYMDLRVWQEEALARLLRNNDDFLAVATPGAGKTTFALTAAQKLIDRGEIENIIVVVPTAHLRGQWSGAASSFGIQLDKNFVNAATVVAKDFDGVVVTYQTVASQPALWRKLTSARKTLVVLDEIHHAGDAERLAWGSTLKEAFTPAVRRLLLSGTPFRSDKQPIPFVRYEDSKCVPSYNYDYGMALADSVSRDGETPKRVVRPIVFPALDGTARWRDAGAIVSAELGAADDKHLSRALRTAFDPEGEWIPSVLRRADEELTRVREDVPDAGGLVFASSVPHAKAYGELLNKITGAQPIVATCDDPEASALIRKFARSDSRWIVAVQMVSEGVDIPRLAVGVYASNIKTQMFFQQASGRLVRVRGNEDETTATLFIPNIQPLLRYAQEIERTVDAVLADEENGLRERAEKSGRQASLDFDLFEPLDSSESVHHSTIYSGESYPDHELRRALEVIQRSSFPAAVTPAQMAHALRIAGVASAGQPLGDEVVSTAHRNLSDEKTALRRLIKKKVGRLQRASDAEYKHIHAKLNRSCGDTVATATAETLNRRLELLDRWLEQA